MRYNREWAVEAAKQGVQILAFYGHVQTGETVGDSCLSQWFPCSFAVEGNNYTTAEQYMMAEKARLFGDEEIRQQILREEDPMACKRLGRQVQQFDKDVWDARCGEIVVAGNIAKFSQNPELKAFLLSTGDAILAEGAPRDKIWGIGMGKSNSLAQDPAQWRGRNLLGFALMEVRDILQES